MDEELRKELQEIKGKLPKSNRNSFPMTVWGANVVLVGFTGIITNVNNQTTTMWFAALVVIGIILTIFGMLLNYNKI